MTYEDKKYNLEIPTLPHEYHDPDEVMLHAIFAVLGMFISEEKDYPVQWDASEESINAHNEITSLWKWWTEERPNRKYPQHPAEISGKNFYDKRLSKEDRDKFLKYFEEVQKIEDEWNKEDQNKLTQLINLRPYLWT